VGVFIPDHGSPDDDSIGRDTFENDYEDDFDDDEDGVSD
jgi:hypothetical protein